jgi:hypothetical protein
MRRTSSYRGTAAACIEMSLQIGRLRAVELIPKRSAAATRPPSRGSRIRRTPVISFRVFVRELLRALRLDGGGELTLALLFASR